MDQDSKRYGVLVIGACGSVSLCSIAGAIAQSIGLHDSTGMVTGLPEFEHLGLPSVSSFVFGGWEIRSMPLADGLTELYRVTRSIDRDTLDAVLPHLTLFQSEVRQGISFGLDELYHRFPDAVTVNESAYTAVERVRADIRDFKASKGLTEVIVVNLSSTEPLPASPFRWHSPDDFRKALLANDPALTPSILYAWAALEESCAYINFTPSVGSELECHRALAVERGLPHTGKDGKTGETLMKTVLAPMFVARNFRVLAWEGFNMLGNRDGLILDHPGSNSAKTANKDAVLRGILGPRLDHTRTRIDLVPSLDDWKVAWDYIHFQGFMGTRMSLSFQWNGCDSMLAAPLVLDLVRLIAFEKSRGARGVQKQLAVFFKNPVDGQTHDLFQQHMALLEHYRRA